MVGILAGLTVGVAIQRHGVQRRVKIKTLGKSSTYSCTVGCACLVDGCSEKDSVPDIDKDVAGQSGFGFLLKQGSDLL